MILRTRSRIARHGCGRVEAGALIEVIPADPQVPTWRAAANHGRPSVEGLGVHLPREGVKVCVRQTAPLVGIWDLTADRNLVATRAEERRDS